MKKPLKFYVSRQIREADIHRNSVVDKTAVSVGKLRTGNSVYVQIRDIGEV
jgi:hypothetical protein